MPKRAPVVSVWAMEDPRQPKPAEILAALLDFRDAVSAGFVALETRIDARFAQVDARFAQMESRFDRVDRRLVSLDDRLTSLEDRFAAFERRRKR